VSSPSKQGASKIARIFREDNRVVVEGVNLVHRHTRPTPRAPNGGIIEREQPIHASNVMLVDPSTGKPTRVHFKTDEKGNKVRVAKSGEEIVAPKRERN